MAKEEFYIGYLPKAPKGIAKFAKVVIAFLFLILLTLAYTLSSSQQFISNGTYEYGELTELEGYLYESPQPFLKIHAGTDLQGQDVFKNILLINYGKFGAHESINKIKEKIGKPLSEVQVKIRGTLIYHNGVTLLELTEKENAYLSSSSIEKEYLYYPMKVGTPNKVNLTGEIVDPKCYFGSMKPGQGKPHRSCAGLCIAGGIPPMFVVQNENQQADYYLILGEEGQQINQEVIPFAADPASISGRIETHDEWKVIYVDPDKIKRLEN